MCRRRPVSDDPLTPGIRRYRLSQSRSSTGLHRVGGDPMQENAGAVSSSEPATTLYGTLIGIVDDREQLRLVCQQLATLGVREVEALAGEAGITRLEAATVTYSAAFMGDMELKTVQAFLDSVRSGKMVFVATIVPELAGPGAEAVKTLGASGVVHFGNSVITSY